MRKVRKLSGKQIPESDDTITAFKRVENFGGFLMRPILFIHNLFAAERVTYFESPYIKALRRLNSHGLLDEQGAAALERFYAVDKAEKPEEEAQSLIDKMGQEHLLRTTLQRQIKSRRMPTAYHAAGNTSSDESDYLLMTYALGGAGGYDDHSKHHNNSGHHGHASGHNDYNHTSHGANTGHNDTNHSSHHGYGSHDTYHHDSGGHDYGSHDTGSDFGFHH